jgi:AcrR family transcriptional regulator
MDENHQRRRRPRRRDTRKGTQRVRLVDALVHGAASGGFGSVTIAGVIERAGVSRPTFYDYFADTEECLLAALSGVQERLLAEVSPVVAQAGASDALGAVIRRVVEWAGAEPEMARVLMGEAVAGGPRALDIRDRGIAEIERLVEGVYERTPRSTPAPDVAVRMLVGGVYRLLARRLRRGEAVTSDLGGELEVWAKRYERPIARHRWRGLCPSPPAALGPPNPPLLKPINAIKRRPRAPARETGQQRERTLFAAAEIAAQHGYAAASISEIGKRAGVDHRAFHREFADQHEVIAALHELFFQHLMTVSAGAFFAQASWPERVWQAGLAFTGAAEQNPTLAHVAFVEGQAAGPTAVQRFEDLVGAFTIFLEQGYQDQTEGERASNVAPEAIAWSTHELAYAQSRAGDRGGLVGLLPHVTFLALAPFLGTTAADAFIDRKLGEPDAAAPD